MTYSHMGTPTLPSAQLRFTSEFGMGSGGTTMLLSLDKKGSILKAFNKEYSLLIINTFLLFITHVRDRCIPTPHFLSNFIQSLHSLKLLGCCMVKPHG